MGNQVNRKQKHIAVRGARLHNLKNIDVDIPHNKLTVITGVSGSGKSTLAFDTIYAEGQRRFVESLSAYARQFLERMAKPDVDSVTGISPAIAIEQKPTSRNPRSTVGTTTEIYDYLRLLYGRIGTTICRECGKIVKKDSPTSVVNEIFKWNEEDKIYILFPFSQQSTDIQAEIEKFKGLGFFRLFQKENNEIIDLDELKSYDGINKEIHLVLADRLILQRDKETESRITDSIETAFRAGGGKIEIRNLTTGRNKRFSKEFECSDCEILYYEPEPRLFSFNNPYGACPHCQGFGRTIGIDEDLVLPDKSRSLKKGAIHPFNSQTNSKHLRALLRVATMYKIPVDEPIRNFTKSQSDFIWDGAGEYIGINGFFSMLEGKSYKIHYRVLLSRYRGYTKCKACGGSRIRTSGRQVFICGKNIPDLIDMPLNKILDFIKGLQLNKHDTELAGQVVNELIWRLGLLVDIGLEYLTLSRLTHTLSGGEAQRINLSTALGSSLVGTLYVLDEPSIGMHPRDTSRLMDILFRLRNLGNTIIIVEHDLDIIRKAEIIIDMGPKAGEQGGEVIYSGDIKEILDSNDSLTGRYLSGKQKIEIPKHTSTGNGKSITLFNPQKHNLKIEKVSFPLGCITVITGVSGSGKSTLVHEVLYKYLQKYHAGYDGHIGSFEKIDGTGLIEAVELVDQSPIGRSSRSTPATYTKAFDAIRELFSNTQAAKQMGFKPGYFSFNVSGGRCEVCEGEGNVTVDMQFLPDVHLECEACKGTRYKRETRSILFNGKSIVDILSMTVDEALAFFKEHRKVVNKLTNLQKVGLGYLRLGQPSNMLSGGESQRVKLAAHLDQKSGKEILFIFDEPTTGLHLHDISRLIGCFRELIKGGHSILIIEHNLHVIASADWVIDLGPEAGEFGGEIVAIGKPKDIAKVENSYTGNALKEFYKEQ
ncbi:excinuclease ABC subunit UvrA [Bacteroidota bacterium]